MSIDNLRLQFLRGDRLANDAYTGANGELTLDQERRAIRMHDGSTQGGILIPTALDPHRAAYHDLPGPSNLVAGNERGGFFGEVTVEDFIAGDVLAAEIGLSAGTDHNLTEPWFKVILDGQVMFFPKKTLKHSLNWNHIYEAGAMFGSGDFGPFVSTANSGTPVKQDATVVINNRRYLVRGFKGAKSNPTPTDNFSYDGVDTHGSEWNRLMYRLHDGNHENSSNTMVSEGIVTGDWAQYSDEELGIGGDRLGRGTLCQETTMLDYPTRRVHRGRAGVSYLGRPHATYTYSGHGWRPILVPLVNQ